MPKKSQARTHNGAGISLGNTWSEVVEIKTKDSLASLCRSKPNKNKKHKAETANSKWSKNPDVLNGSKSNCPKDKWDLGALSSVFHHPNSRVIRGSNRFPIAGECSSWQVNDSNIPRMQVPGNKESAVREVSV
jgi:hypothetical protein